MQKLCYSDQFSHDWAATAWLYWGFIDHYFRKLVLVKISDKLLESNFNFGFIFAFWHFLQRKFSIELYIREHSLIILFRKLRPGNILLIGDNSHNIPFHTLPNFFNFYIKYKFTLGPIIDSFHRILITQISHNNKPINFIIKLLTHVLMQFMLPRRIPQLYNRILSIFILICFNTGFHTNCRIILTIELSVF